jgi:hypothetical protein
MRCRLPKIDFCHRQEQGRLCSLLILTPIAEKKPLLLDDPPPPKANLA